MRHADVVIAGAGPAGMAAAIRAAESGRSVVVLDDNPAAGGQIWRASTHGSPARRATRLFHKFERCGAELVSGARIVGGDSRARTLLVECAHHSYQVGYERLIIATGARELFLPFPGWTLPNVTGVGGLQALMKSGLPVRGKTIVVAGSGPLLLAVAAYLRHRGATVLAIAEQTDLSRLLRFGAGLLGYPSKLWQAAALASAAYRTSCWVTAAEGDQKLKRVHLRHGSTTCVIECDYLAVAYGFRPNVELAIHLGCQVEDAVTVDEHQQTSVPGIYCAGEAAGIGGVDLALLEGEIAGLSAGGMENHSKSLFPARTKARAFSRALEETFAPRSELRTLADSNTIVCRCEDVTFERLQKADSWRAAKLHLRCGMGPCQGRICGPAVQFLFGWQAESIRLPIFPARVQSLLSEPISSEKGIVI